jgi:hypothetical protein
MFVHLTLDRDAIVLSRVLAMIILEGQTSEQKQVEE